jgi:hypothetical protein
MRSSWRVRRSGRNPLRPLFREDRPVAVRLMSPGFFTRTSDRAVSFLSRFQNDTPKQPFIQVDLSERSPMRTAVAFAVPAVVLSTIGQTTEAPLFFGTQAAVMIGLKAWFGWHRRNPPARDAGSTRRGVLSALAHATGAFAVGLFAVYTMRRAIPFLVEESDWLINLEHLMLATGLGVITYQRRTGWNEDDPERHLIIGAIAVAVGVFALVIRSVL